MQGNSGRQGNPLTLFEDEERDIVGTRLGDFSAMTKPNWYKLGQGEGVSFRVNNEQIVYPRAAPWKALLEIAVRVSTLAVEALPAVSGLTLRYVACTFPRWKE